MTQPVDKTKLKCRVLQEGQYGRHTKDFSGAMIFSKKEHLDLSLGIKQEVVDSVNFDTEYIVYIASGTKPTGFSLYHVFIFFNTELII